MSSGASNKIRVTIEAWENTMYRALLPLLIVNGCFLAGAQTYHSLGGFGSVLYPGTGHPPANGGIQVPQNGRNGNRGGGQYRGNRGGGVAYPLYYGYYPAYGTGYYDSPPPDPNAGAYPPVPPPAPAPPSVIINQTFVS